MHQPSHEKDKIKKTHFAKKKKNEKKTFSQTSENNEGNKEFRSEKAERKDPSTKAASPVKTTTFLTDPVKHLRSKVFMGLGHKNGATKCITVWA